MKNTVEIEKKCSEANGPVFVTKNGYGKLVVMDIEYYERTMKKAYEAKVLGEGLADLKNGNLLDGEDLKEKIAAKYDF